MSKLVKTKRQANFKDFKRFGAFKGLVKQKKTLYSTRSCVKAHECQKRPNLRTNSLNKLLHILLIIFSANSSKHVKIKYALNLKFLPAHLSHDPLITKHEKKLLD
jgi:hypothetical protein